MTTRKFSVAGPLLLILVFTFRPTLAQEYQRAAGKNPAFATVIEDPTLPRVLLIGDSISIGYTPYVQEQLQGIANVHRIPTNGGPTTRGLEAIDAWLGDTKWDVIHFNWGLHDLKFVNEKGDAVPPAEGKYQVPLDEYEKNLTQLVERLKQTQARLIWRNTTPVPAGTKIRIEHDEQKYNDVAAQIMKKHGIPTDDHHQFVLEHQPELQKPADVHFTPIGSEKLAGLVTAAIKKELAK